MIKIHLEIPYSSIAFLKSDYNYTQYVVYQNHLGLTRLVEKYDDEHEEPWFELYKQETLVGAGYGEQINRSFVGFGGVSFKIELVFSSFKLG